RGTNTVNLWHAHRGRVNCIARRARLSREAGSGGTRTMKLRRLGKTGLWVAEIGLGTWQLRRQFRPAEDGGASTTLANAARLGINFWDTADVYGDGFSEHRIGTFYGKPEDLVVATKVGRSAALYPDKYTRAGVRESLEDSARRLLVDAIDLAQLHCV